MTAPDPFFISLPANTANEADGHCIGWAKICQPAPRGRECQSASLRGRLSTRLVTGPRAERWLEGARSLRRETNAEWVNRRNRRWHFGARHNASRHEPRSSPAIGG